MFHSLIHRVSVRSRFRFSLVSLYSQQIGESDAIWSIVLLWLPIRSGLDLLPKLLLLLLMPWHVTTHTGNNESVLQFLFPQVLAARGCWGLDCVQRMSRSFRCSWHTFRCSADKAGKGQGKPKVASDPWRSTEIHEAQPESIAIAAIAHVRSSHAFSSWPSMRWP